MEFKKYSSIENSYRQKYISILKEKGVDNKEFIVQEKVHGANFSVWYDGKEFKYAKRSGFLKGDNFFNYPRATEDIKPKVEKMYSLIKEEYGTLDVLVIYGELCGGHYKHPDVEQVNTKMVQKGIQYCPDVMFYAFDMKIDGAFQSIDFCNDFFEKVDLFHAKTLFTGSFDECLMYSNKFQTTIPKELGLPEIEDNICEGVVIKPNEPMYLNDGSRVVLKNKNEKWTEKEKVKVKKEPIKLNEEEQKVLEEMLSYVNENRLRNVLSKVGEVTNKDFGKIMGMFQKDAHDDFLKDNGDVLEDLDNANNIKKTFGKECAELIRSNFLNIIDGAF